MVKRVISTWGLIQLTTRTEKFRARIPFLVVQNLAVDCILGILYIEYHVKAILPEIWKVLFDHFSSAAITGQRSLLKGEHLSL